MKNTFIKLLLLVLAMTLAFSLVACGKDGGDGNTDGGDDTNDTPSGDTGDTGNTDGGNDDPENLVLITGNVAKFRLVTTNDINGDLKKSTAAFIENLTALGVAVDDIVRDTESDGATDCEIIVGTGVKNRDAKYVLDPHDYGEEGYVIKIVDNKVLIGGGTNKMTSDAFDYFVKNVVKLTNKTKEMSELSLARSYERLKKTDYLISSVSIAGNDLKDYVFVTDLGEDISINSTESIKNFRTRLYNETGYWLENVKPADLKEGQKAIIVRSVEDAGADGFRAYVDSEQNLVMECAYYNAIDGAFDHIVRTYIFDKINDVTFSKSFSKTLPVSVVYYSQFGAVGDGVTDDYVAIYNTHAFANQCGQKVMGDAGKTYFLHIFTKTVPIKTNVDWNGATFLIDDTGSEVHKNRGLDLFELTSTAKTIKFNAQQIAELFPDVTIKKGATELPWLAEYIDNVSFVTLFNEHRDYIRHGSNTSRGYQRQDVVIINPDGTLHEDTEVIWDFEPHEQFVQNWAGTKFKADADGNPTWFGATYVKSPALSAINIVEANDEPIVVENGIFNRIACTSVPESKMENVYLAYNRGICVRRCNSTVRNIKHCDLVEPEFPEIQNTSGALGTPTGNAYYGVDTSKGNNGLVTDEAGSRYFIGQSYPYGGMVRFRDTYNSRLVDSFLTGRTVYYEAKSTSSTPVAMGSYDLHIVGSSHVYIENVQQLNDINDTHYWGIMNSNRAKNLFFTNSSLSRFDAHEGFWNGTFTNTTFGRYINVIGGGHLKIEGCTRNVGQNFISLRGDYGATFNGTIEIVNSKIMGWKEYRRMQPTVKEYEGGKPLYIIASGYSAKVDGEYAKGNAGSYPYLKWRFGYTCYLPQHLIIDNFTTPNSGANLFVYNNVGDEAFVKPDNFVKPIDYEGQTVTLTDGSTRPMTEDDVYYNQYQITKSLVFRNMDKLLICPNTKSHLFYTLDELAVVE